MTGCGLGTERKWGEKYDEAVKLGFENIKLRQMLVPFRSSSKFRAAGKN